MIYKLGTGKDPFEDNPELKLIPKFEVLTPREMLFVCLVCDPKTPLRTLFGRERRDRAAQLAGYPMEGTRLDKNGRNAATGKIARVEEAIEEFKAIHYDERQHSRDALKKQIVEIRDFLTEDKKVPLTYKNEITQDSEGKDVWVTDQKALKLASDLGKSLPDLLDALERMEATMKIEEPFQGNTFTVDDLDTGEDEDGRQDVPMIEQIVMRKSENNV